MTFLYVAHLILTGLMGIQGITTVSKVSVKAGDSIAIPCLYNLVDYKDNVKCLCKGKCIFTVTIHNLQEDGTSYWCAIEKKVYDVKQRFELSVTTGMPSLHVDQQEITAFEGGSVTVKCHSENPKVTKWCRLGSSSCVLDQTGSIDRATVTINTSVSNVFTVTMSGLKTENSGWYWCVKGDLQMPVHITVHELTSTTSTTPTTSTTISSTATTLQTATQNASLFTSAEPPTVQPSFSTVIGTGGESLQDKNKSSTLVWILPTTLVLLLLVVPTAFFGWRMKKKRNKTKTEVPVITGGAEVERDPDVHYATILHNPDAASQLKQNNISEETVTYN
ncbi:hypothetical protein NQZ68_003005 [Dissostichus eleginoides]|nr:hypothetical protein NQZ68_003005 [Dissostichus eleginoides]